MNGGNPIGNENEGTSTRTENMAMTTVNNKQRMSKWGNTKQHTSEESRRKPIWNSKATFGI